MSGTAAAPGIALEVQGVDFAYPQRPVLEGVSFQVPAGAFCVLLGVNGAGKTTLFSLITRLFVCPKGAIRILGHDVRGHSRAALKHLGVVFQQPTLDLDLSVRQNLKYHCALHGLDQALLRPRVDQALQALGLDGRAGDKVRRLSGGQRRRLELARALLHEPRLLLADEPTVGLDIHSRQAILQQVRDGCRDRDVGVLWATHLVDEVQPRDQVVILHLGRVLAQGLAERLMADSGTDSVHDAFTAITRGERQ